MTFDEWFAAIVKEDANPAGLMKEQDFARECWEAGYAACSRADAEAAIARAREKRTLRTGSALFSRFGPIVVDEEKRTVTFEPSVYVLSKPITFGILTETNVTGVYITPEVEGYRHGDELDFKIKAK